MDWVEFKQVAAQQWKGHTSLRAYALGYRKIPEEVILRFGIGATKSSQVHDLNICPLDIKKRLAGAKKDRDWLMVPLEALDGTPLGIELRQPETKGFFKVYFSTARVYPPFFGLAQSLGYLTKLQKMAIVEGVFDLLSFAAVTKFPVVSYLTKYPSKKQDRWICRWAKKIILFLDNDEEGRRTSGILTNRKQSGALFVDSHWYAAPSVQVGDLKDLNLVLQRLGWNELKKTLEFGLKNNA